MPGSQQLEAAVQCSAATWYVNMVHPDVLTHGFRHNTLGLRRNIHMQAMVSALHINEQGLLKLKCTAACQAILWCTASLLSNR